MVKFLNLQGKIVMNINFCLTLSGSKHFHRPAWYHLCVIWNYRLYHLKLPQHEALVTPFLPEMLVKLLM